MTKARLARVVVALIAPVGLAADIVASPAAHAQQGGAPPATPVEAITVQPSVLERKMEAVGSLRANESVVVRPEEPGRIVAIAFEEGRPVASGSVLFRLDSAVFRAELDRSKARLALNQTEFRRTEELIERKAVSATERDRALAGLRVSEADVALAEAHLARMTLRAPFDGVLGLRRVSIGEFVQAGDDLVSLVDIDPLKVDFRIPEVALAALRVGQEVAVRLDALPGESFVGAVYAIDPQVDVNGRAVILRATIDNPQGRLRPGLFARVDLVLERKTDVLLVPEEALMPQGERQQVYTIVDGAAKLTPVRTGDRRAGKVEIVSGLEPGDTVVTAGQLKLRPGAAVAPVAPADAEPAAEATEDEPS